MSRRPPSALLTGWRWPAEYVGKLGRAGAFAWQRDHMWASCDSQSKESLSLCRGHWVPSLGRCFTRHCALGAHRLLQVTVAFLVNHVKS